MTAWSDGGEGQVQTGLFLSHEKFKLTFGVCQAQALGPSYNYISMQWDQCYIQLRRPDTSPVPEGDTDLSGWPYD
jgi:hypothetical protein